MMSTITQPFPHLPEIKFSLCGGRDIGSGLGEEKKIAWCSNLK